jgi:chromosome segregation ATPase
VRTQLETALKTEMFNHEKELEKLRDDFSRQLSAANDKIAQQGRENTELHGKVATLQTALTTQKITMEQEMDRAVSVARELEKDRNEQTIADLRQRLEVLTNKLGQTDRYTYQYYMLLRKAAKRIYL